MDRNHRKTCHSRSFVGRGKVRCRSIGVDGRPAHLCRLQSSLCGNLLVQEMQRGAILQCVVLHHRLEAATALAGVCPDGWKIHWVLRCVSEAISRRMQLLQIHLLLRQRVSAQALVRRRSQRKMPQDPNDRTGALVIDPDRPIQTIGASGTFFEKMLA